MPKSIELSLLIVSRFQEVHCITVHMLEPNSIMASTDVDPPQLL